MEKFVIRGDCLMLALDFLAVLRWPQYDPEKKPWGIEKLSRSRCSQIAQSMTGKWDATLFALAVGVPPYC